MFLVVVGFGGAVVGAACAAVRRPSMHEESVLERALLRFAELRQHQVTALGNGVASVL
jgi:hypothetical protein